jgi:hypothetical protein
MGEILAPCLSFSFLLCCQGYMKLRNKLGLQGVGLRKVREVELQS